ncbi:MAG: alanine--tRNA ligase [Gammaproteobacteria bacterium]|nr:alanine--tRNA ligase [Gammaproteobacteria bacterium]
MITTSEIRQKFLDFFQQQGHQVVSSSSLVPGTDKTLLFTNAGMVQFKDVFVGTDKRPYSTAVTSQRCVRAGGKHNDLDNVGYTARHHTFFEMLGNFSFGDYFKHDAIRYAWQFLTVELGLPAEKLWVTVFEEDDEAHDIWVNEIGVPAERVARIGAADNFWMMGDTGPCGPCSEIFYDHGPEVWGGPPGTPDEDGDRYIEIWNLVFMQFDRSADGSMTPLPKPSVDTGMGLERIAAVLQHVHSNYEIDLFTRLIDAVAKVVGTSVVGTEDKSSASLRVIADHIRSCAFLIADGVLPSNEGRGYVLRRIIRRAARHGHKLGATEPFFHKLVAPLIEVMGDAYPELAEKQASLQHELQAEEVRFNTTLASGMKILEDALTTLDGTTIPGDIVFKLYDTYGFPLDLTADIARERGLTVDQAGFDLAMGEQRKRAQAASNFGVVPQNIKGLATETRFEGYERTNGSALVQGIYVDGAPVDSLDSSQQGVVLLDSSPFYGESGGQVGDRGEIASDNAHFVVHDTQKQGAALLHAGSVTSGALAVGDKVVTHVDRERRLAIVRNHSATHLLHAALRETLGTHVEQKGSLVNEHQLRFDFSHGSPVQADELRTIERWVNDQIRLNSEVTIQQMTMDEALAAGAMALFGEKYGDVVRVVTIGAQSTELCGGTHVHAAGDVGAFRIASETGTASGVRRIEALTGAAALDAIEQDRETLRQIAMSMKAAPATVGEKVSQLQVRNKELLRELEKLQARLSAQASGDLADSASDINGIKVLTHRVDPMDVKALRTLMDQLKQKLGSTAIVLASEHKGKGILLAGVTAPLNEKIKAGDLVNVVAAPLGGKGGGRPDMAQAGAESLDGVEAALALVNPWIADRLADGQI